MSKQLTLTVKLDESRAEKEGLNLHLRTVETSLKHEIELLKDQVNTARAEAIAKVSNQV